jgi:D-alanyl-D-alanine carboxypeptidase
MPAPRVLPRTLGRVAALVALSVALAAPAGLAVAQPVADSRARVAAGGLDPAGLQEALDAVTAGEGVGAVAQVVGAKAQWSSASGVRRLAGGQPAARAQDRARVASVTKSMVATLALQEVQRGRWRLSTTVDDVLPGLLPGHGDITVAQLLSHRSGAPDYLAALLATATSTDAFLDVVEHRYTDRQLVSAALTLPWSFAPGTAFGYSNTNYVVVGMMLARTNRRPVGALLERRIFDPARMGDSSLPRTPRFEGPHLTEYAFFPGEEPVDLRGFEPSVFSAAGAVVSTPRDLNRFYRALLTGRLLRPDLVRQMTRPRTTEPLAYGLGVYSLPDPCPTADGSQQLVHGHDGASFGTLTIAFSSPDGRRQVALSVTGRSFDPAAAPPPIGEFAVAALLATCPHAPSAGDSARRSSPSLTLPDLDGAATAAPLIRR